MQPGISMSMNVIIFDYYYSCRKVYDSDSDSDSFYWTFSITTAIILNVYINKKS